MGVGLLTFVFLTLNLRAAVRARPRMCSGSSRSRWPCPAGWCWSRCLQRLLKPVTAVLAFLIGLSASAEWQTLLLYRNARTFGVTDPLFERDVAFYVFQLPLWRRGLSWISGSSCSPC